MKIKPLLSPATNENPQAGIGIGGVELQYVGENSLLPVIGPLGNIAEADEIKSYRISTYRVREGDSLSGVARKFYGNVSKWTLVYEANKDKIRDPDRIEPGIDITLAVNKWIIGTPIEP